MPVSPQRQLDSFIDRYTPAIATLARACLKKMRACRPGATQLVYDNYNALVIGFGPSGKPSEAIFSLVLYPRWVSLFFLRGSDLPDPKKLLRGSGSRVRHVVIQEPDDLDQPVIQSLMNAALRHAQPTIDPAAPGELIIQSISAKQRPRRP